MVVEVVHVGTAHAVGAVGVDVVVVAVMTHAVGAMAVHVVMVPHTVVAVGERSIVSYGAHASGAVSEDVNNNAGAHAVDAVGRCPLAQFDERS